MYILQNGKLYLQLSGNKLVGVEIYPDHTLQIKGTETIIGKDFLMLTKREVDCKFHIDEKPYIFPQEKKVEVKKEVVTNGAVDTVQKPVRKSTRK